MGAVQKQITMAERAGFEPALGYYPKHAFQACDLNRSSTSPGGGKDKPEAYWTQDLSISTSFSSAWKIFAASVYKHFMLQLCIQ